MPFVAPAPPLHMKWLAPNGRPVRRLNSIVAGRQQRARHAAALSGTAWASASHTDSIIACEAAMVQPVTGAGSEAFTTVPGGAMTSSARSAPSLKRTPEPMDVNSARNDDETV